MTPIFQDEFISRQSQWTRRALFATLALLAGSIGLIAYLIVTKPVRIGILVTDKHGQPIGAIQPVTATGDLPTALVNAYVNEFLAAALTITSDATHDEYLYGLVLGTPGHAGWAQGAARARLVAFYSGKGDPRQRYLREEQWVRTTSVTKLPDDGWYEATCTLYVQAHNDEHVTNTDWKVTMKVEWSDVTATNPYGIYTSEMDMQPVTQ